MTKEYTSLGLMSGTSGDGVDASIIKSDGKTKYTLILDKYFKYDEDIYENIHELKQKLYSPKDLVKFSEEINNLEKKITIFHAKIIKKIPSSSIDLVGFHGQTIFHNAKQKISKQLGDGNLLSQLIKKDVVNNFRENDIKNGGQGAPLTPIYHKLFVNEKKINLPVIILNIGGIANITILNEDENFFSTDIGPGNCLIDLWIRTNINKKFDMNGDIAKSGKINKIILDQSLENFYENDLGKNKSYDVNDFDLNFIRGLSLEDGAATLTEFTADILSRQLLKKNIYACGGGRKNKFLLERIQKKIGNKIHLIDEVKINGDFVESQAFAYLAIRSYIDLPISFPETTGCSSPCTGGKIIKFK